MTSQRKISANRHNAQRSTGPKSARGKARSRYNAVKWGIYWLNRPLTKEDNAAYQRLTRRLLRRYAPSDPVEELIVDQILGHIWRINRLERAERAYLEKIQETRCKRAVKFQSFRRPPAKQDSEHSDSSVRAQALRDAVYFPTCACSQPNISDDLDGTFLEAAIDRHETQPLVALAAERSAHLQEILWLQKKLELDRKSSFNHFVSAG
jgi:hypothetical protein